MENIISQLLHLTEDTDRCQAGQSMKTVSSRTPHQWPAGRKSTFLQCSAGFQPVMTSVSFIILFLQLRHEKNFVKSLAGIRLSCGFEKSGFSVFSVICKARHYWLNFRLWKCILLQLLLLPNLLHYSGWAISCWDQFRVKLMLKILFPLSIHRLFSRKLN